MSNKKVITSYTSHTTAEGERLSYTYSEIDEQGNLVKSNVRATCIVVDNEVLGKIKEINDFLLRRESTTV
ncbi:peptide chain release factor 2 [Clostridium sp. HBUAS56017]|uniref:peptide chain release factor 2 n=1 Tax=Clostridium sp. HBUAS56017 TaxID=2571128 RepID=UPI0011788049|nr:peptide chain release factor 2 [Clostridium sp. HBUAS56017]